MWNTIFGFVLVTTIFSGGYGYGYPKQEPENPLQLPSESGDSSVSGYPKIVPDNPLQIPSGSSDQSTFDRIPVDTKKEQNVHKPDNHHHHGEHGHYDPHDDGTGWDIRKSVPGEPNRDYPTYDSVPTTTFTCAEKHPGYYADEETRCQIFRVCTTGSVNAFNSFLCPNGSLFNQAVLTCDWWQNVDCQASQKFYYKNKEIGKMPSGTQLMYEIKKMLEAPKHHPYDYTKQQQSIADNQIQGSLDHLQDYLPPKVTTSIVYYTPTIPTTTERVVTIGVMYRPSEESSNTFNQGAIETQSEIVAPAIEYIPPPLPTYGPPASETSQSQSLQPLPLQPVYGVPGTVATQTIQPLPIITQSNYGFPGTIPTQIGHGVTVTKEHTKTITHSEKTTHVVHGQNGPEKISLNHSNNHEHGQQNAGHNYHGTKTQNVGTHQTGYEHGHSGHHHHGGYHSGHQTIGQQDGTHYTNIHQIGGQHHGGSQFGDHHNAGYHNGGYHTGVHHHDYHQTGSLHHDGQFNTQGNAQQNFNGAQLTHQQVVPQQDNVKLVQTTNSVPAIDSLIPIPVPKEVPAISKSDAFAAIDKLQAEFEQSLVNQGQQQEQEIIAQQHKLQEQAQTQQKLEQQKAQQALQQQIIAEQQKLQEQERAEAQQKLEQQKAQQALQQQIIAEQQKLQEQEKAQAQLKLEQEKAQQALQQQIIAEQQKLQEQERAQAQLKLEQERAQQALQQQIIAEQQKLQEQEKAQAQLKLEQEKAQQALQQQIITEQQKLQEQQRLQALQRKQNFGSGLLDPRFKPAEVQAQAPAFGFNSQQKVNSQSSFGQNAGFSGFEINEHPGFYFGHGQNFGFPGPYHSHDFHDFARIVNEGSGTYPTVQNFQSQTQGNQNSGLQNQGAPTFAGEGFQNAANQELILQNQGFFGNSQNQQTQNPGFQNGFQSSNFQSQSKNVDPNYHLSSINNFNYHNKHKQQNANIEETKNSASQNYKGESLSHHHNGHSHSSYSGHNVAYKETTKVDIVPSLGFHLTGNDHGRNSYVSAVLSGLVADKEGSSSEIAPTGTYSPYDIRYSSYHGPSSYLVPQSSVQRLPSDA